MLYYKDIKTLLSSFVNLKLEYNSFLHSRINILKILKGNTTDNYNISSEDDEYNKYQDAEYINKELQSTNKEINKDKFKLKYYKQYLEQLETTLEHFFEDYEDIILDDETEFNLDIKNKFLDFDEIKKHKSLFKRVETIFTDDGNTFTKKDITTLTKKLDKLKEQNTQDNEYINKLNKQNGINTDNIDTSNIEAVPKLLAEEGERPGDDDPIGQKVYDLRLLFGIGENKARDFVKKGITFQQLINEWDSFTKESETKDILMLKKLPDPPNQSFNNLTHDRMLNNRFNYLKQQMYSCGYEGLSYCNYDQLVGIKHFKDMAIKIPRAEIIKMEKYLNIIVKHINPDLIITCCGSYRRGRDRSGDMDCLLTHTKLKTAEDIDNFQAARGSIISVLVKVLTDKGFLTDHLSEGPKKYMGLCKLPNRPEYTIHRRIDIKMFPYNSYATGILYFTGSKNLNKEMRTKALGMGMTLNEYGLYKLEYCKEKRKKVAGEQISTPTEEDVFKVLKMKYLSPTERDI